MALTGSEMEAKLAALEERVALLFEFTDTLELRFEHGMVLWEGWAVELQGALSTAEKQISRLRRGLPPPRPESGRQD